MGLTPNHQIPYAELNEPADVPAVEKAMAERIDELIGTQPPVGSIVMWALPTPPSGWVFCQGQAAPSGSKLAELMATVPDLRDRVPVGASGTKALDSVGGAETVTLADTQTPIRQHDHHLQAVASGGTPPVNGSVPSVNGGNKSVALGGTTAGGTTRVMPLPINGQFYYGLQVGAVAGNAVAVAAHSNMQPYRAINYIIRAG